MPAPKRTFTLAQRLARAQRASAWNKANREKHRAVALASYHRRKGDKK